MNSTLILSYAKLTNSRQVPIQRILMQYFAMAAEYVYVRVNVDRLSNIEYHILSPIQLLVRRRRSLLPFHFYPVSIFLPRDR